MDEKIKISMMETLQIKTASPFKDLFPIRETAVAFGDSAGRDGLAGGRPAGLYGRRPRGIVSYADTLLHVDQCAARWIARNSRLSDVATGA